MYKHVCLVLLISTFSLSACVTNQPRWVGYQAAVYENLKKKNYSEVKANVDFLLQEVDNYGDDGPPYAKTGPVESMLPLQDIDSYLGFRGNMLRLADDLLDEKQHTEAGQLYELILDMDKKEKGEKAYKELYLDSLLFCLMRINRLDRAEVIMDLRDENESDRVKVYESRARFYEKADQLDKAEYYINEAIKLPTTKPEKRVRLYRLMASFFWNRRDLKRQEEYLVKALELARKTPGADELGILYSLVPCYKRQGKTDLEAKERTRMVVLKRMQKKR